MVPPTTPPTPPIPPSPTPASMSKFPSGGKNTKKQNESFFEDVLKIFVGFGMICMDLWGPKWSTPTPIPASMSKFPSGGKNMEKCIFYVFVYDSYEKELKNDIKIVLK